MERICWSLARNEADREERDFSQSDSDELAEDNRDWRDRRESEEVRRSFERMIACSTLSDASCARMRVPTRRFSGVSY